MEAAFMECEWLRRLFRKPEDKVAAFCRDREPQRDEEYVSSCVSGGAPDLSRVAIAVRRTVARVGRVEPEFIKADDVYPDQLETLPTWDCHHRSVNPDLTIEKIIDAFQKYARRDASWKKDFRWEPTQLK
jgi:hypothetical protein